MSMTFKQIRSATAVLTFGGVRFLIDPWFADKGAFPPIPIANGLSAVDNTINELIYLWRNGGEDSETLPWIADGDTKA